MSSVLELPCGTSSVLTCAGEQPLYLERCGPPNTPPAPQPCPCSHLCSGGASSAPQHPAACPCPLLHTGLGPGEGLTMRRACWLLPRPHICRGKAGDKLEAGTHWHPAGPAQPRLSHTGTTVSSAWHRAPAWPGQPPRASLPCSPRAKHSQAQHSLAQHGAERTHPQQPRVPPGCPAGPHPPQPRCPPWGRPPPPLPVALRGRGTPQPGTLPPRGVSSTGTPRWCNGDSLALMQDAAAHTSGGCRGQCLRATHPHVCTGGDTPTEGSRCQGAGLCPGQSHACLLQAVLVPLLSPVWNSMVLSISAT